VTEQASLVAAALVVAMLVSAGCAPKRLELPTGAGEPAPDAQAIVAQTLVRCRALRTLTAEIRLSGRAGRQKLRGRLIAGFQAPDSLRLEAAAPFGPPVFILAASGEHSTLLLPRDARVLTDAPPAGILAALAGPALSPGELLPLLAGCPAIDPTITDVRRHGTAWLSFASDRSTVYLRERSGTWTIVAIERPALRVDYSQVSGAQPGTIQLRDPTASASRFDLSLAMSQVEINVEIPKEAFVVKVPDDAVPMTLDDLRQAGPMRDETEQRHGTS
jgi:outer membrane lipoprotein-sorting protein